MFNQTKSIRRRTIETKPKKKTKKDKLKMKFAFEIPKLMKVRFTLKQFLKNKYRVGGIK